VEFVTEILLYILISIKVSFVQAFGWDFKSILFTGRYRKGPWRHCKLLYLCTMLS